MTLREELEGMAKELEDWSMDTSPGAGLPVDGIAERMRVLAERFPEAEKPAEPAPAPAPLAGVLEKAREALDGVSWTTSGAFIACPSCGFPSDRNTPEEELRHRHFDYCELVAALAAIEAYREPEREPPPEAARVAVALLRQLADRLDPSRIQAGHEKPLEHWLWSEKQTASEAARDAAARLAESVPGGQREELVLSLEESTAKLLRAESLIRGLVPLVDPTRRDECDRLLADAALAPLAPSDGTQNVSSRLGSSLTGTTDRSAESVPGGAEEEATPVALLEAAQLTANSLRLWATARNDDMASDDDGPFTRVSREYMSALADQLDAALAAARSALSGAAASGAGAGACAAVGNEQARKSREATLAAQCDHRLRELLVPVTGGGQLIDDAAVVIGRWALSHVLDLEAEVRRLPGHPLAATPPAPAPSAPALQFSTGGVHEECGPDCKETGCPCLCHDADDAPALATRPEVAELKEVIEQIARQAAREEVASALARLMKPALEEHVAPNTANFEGVKPPQGPICGSRPSLHSGLYCGLPEGHAGVHVAHYTKETWA